MDVGAKKGPRSDINITPLVDVVLVLLIIFMVLTPLMEKEIAVRVPEEPDQTQAVEPPPPDLLQILFKVDEAGVFHVNNETLTDENAVDRLKVWYRAAKSKEPTQGPPVIFFDAAKAVGVSTRLPAGRPRVQRTMLDLLGAQDRSFSASLGNSDAVESAIRARVRRS